VLSENGLNELAYRLLLNEDYPSWGYMVRKGATTIWERWNGDTGDPGMNSYNHYAYGAVGEWLYREVAGIGQRPDGVGFKRIVIRPRPDARLSQARGEYECVYGKIVSEWRRVDKGAMELDVRIPANTSARVYLPGADPSKVTESGKSIAGSPEVRLAASEQGSAVYDVEPGTYHFRWSE
jgi:alpha-L-rhamnosidase